VVVEVDETALVWKHFNTCVLSMRSLKWSSPPCSQTVPPSNKSKPNKTATPRPGSRSDGDDDVGAAGACMEDSSSQQTAVSGQPPEYELPLAEVGSAAAADLLDGPDDGSKS
jgi:hypothetical protein